MHNSNSHELTGFVYLSTLTQVHSSGVPSDTAKIRAIIHPENQQTQMAMYTVPYNSTMYISHGWASISKEQITEANVSIWTRPLGGVFRKLHTVSLQTSGSSSDHRPYDIPITLEGGTDIVYRVEVFSNGTGVSAGFHAICETDESVTLEPIEPADMLALTGSNGDSLVDNNVDTLVSY